jgi:stage V sporulation protein G
VKLHADIAHPINSACREVIQSAVLKAFQAEKDRSKQPGYVCTYDDYDSDYDGTFTQVVGELTPPRGGYRTHEPHPSNHGGTHEPAQQPAKDKRSEGFGAGVF